MGFSLEPSFIIPSHLRSLFIQNTSGEYLQEIVWQQHRYIGKFIDPLATIPSLELIESNIHSLLKKLVPDDHTYSPLILFPVIS